MDRFYGKKRFFKFKRLSVVVVGFLIQAFPVWAQAAIASSSPTIQNIALPFPQACLQSETLEYFYSYIMEEVQKEFSLQNDSRTCRNTREYGYSFFKMEQGDRSYSPPPSFLNELGHEVCKCLGHEPQSFTNIILSVYDKGFHLEPHVDTNASGEYLKGYYFDEKVYGIIIEPDATGHLYFVKDEENAIPPLNLTPIYNLKEKRGSVFCLQGKFRKAPYFHGVSKVSNRRISITFRKVIFENECD